MARKIASSPVAGLGTVNRTIPFDGIRTLLNGCCLAQLTRRLIVARDPAGTTPRTRKVTRLPDVVAAKRRVSASCPLLRPATVARRRARLRRRLLHRGGKRPVELHDSGAGRLAAGERRQLHRLSGVARERDAEHAHLRTAWRELEDVDRAARAEQRRHGRLRRGGRQAVVVEAAADPEAEVEAAAEAADLEAVGAAEAAAVAAAGPAPALGSSTSTVTVRLRTPGTRAAPPSLRAHR